MYHVVFSKHNMGKNRKSTLALCLLCLSKFFPVSRRGLLDLAHFFDCDPDLKGNGDTILLFTVIAASRLLFPIGFEHCLPYDPNAPCGGSSQ